MAWQHHSAAPRRAAESGPLTHPDFRGVVLQPDVNGVIWPSSTDEVRLCDNLGLPVVIDAVEQDTALVALGDHTKAELIAIAEGRGIEVNAKANKQALVEAIEAADAEPDDDGSDEPEEQE